MLKFLFIEFINRLWLLSVFLIAFILETLFGLVWDHTYIREVYTRHTLNILIDIVRYGKW